MDYVTDAVEEFYGRTVILADREMVEQQSDVILEGAEEEDIAFLVVGDPFGATTHSDLVLRATARNIKYRVVHNASIMNAVGCCGLQLYNFGETVSIVIWTETWRPNSFYDKIAQNRKHKLHTLCLLDIKVKEQSIENMMRGRPIYEPPRFMTVCQAASQLLEIIEEQKDSDTESLAYTAETICVGLARIGTDTQVIKVATLKEMTSLDLGGPLHSFIITGHLHPLEMDMLRQFTVDPSILP